MVHFEISYSPARETSKQVNRSLAMRLKCTPGLNYIYILYILNILYNLLQVQFLLMLSGV